MKYEMKFMFDWGSGVCLWSTNDAAIKEFDYPVSLEQLPISLELKDKLEYLIRKHDEALDWNDPAGDLLWDEDQQTEFEESAKAAYYLLSSELGDNFQIELWKTLI